MTLPPITRPALLVLANTLPSLERLRAYLNPRYYAGGDGGGGDGGSDADSPDLDIGFPDLPDFPDIGDAFGDLIGLDFGGGGDGGGGGGGDGGGGGS